jgi:hypothetical protein
MKASTSPTGSPPEQDALVEPLASQRRHGLGQGMGSLELDVPVGADDHEPGLANAPGQVGEQEEGRLVGPVEVVQHEDEGPDARGRYQERGDSLEEPMSFGLALERRQLRQMGKPVAQLGDDRGDLRAPRGRVEQVALVG